MKNQQTRWEEYDYLVLFTRPGSVNFVLSDRKIFILPQSVEAYLPASLACLSL
jgi:hypothetical protein